MKERPLMQLKVLMPQEILLNCPRVERVVAESADGFFGLWPRRLDGAAVLVPGILTYQAEGEAERYVAHDQGVLVKVGLEVTVSVRYAVAGVDLGSLRRLVETRLGQLSVSERQMRSMATKIGSEMMRETARFQHD